MSSNTSPTAHPKPPPLVHSPRPRRGSVANGRPVIASQPTQRTGDAFIAWLRAVNYKSLAFTVFIVFLLGMIYWVVNSQGIRISLPTLGMKLHKVPLPGFSILAHYKGLRDLDLAHMLALAMLIAVWFLSVGLLKVLLFGYEPNERLNASFHLPFLYCVSAIVIFTDLTMFYVGVADQGGLLTGSGGFTPLVATVGYAGLIAFVAYTHVMFKRRYW